MKRTLLQIILLCVLCGSEVRIRIRFDLLILLCLFLQSHVVFFSIMRKKKQCIFKHAAFQNIMLHLLVLIAHIRSTDIRHVLIWGFTAAQITQEAI